MIATYKIGQVVRLSDTVTVRDQPADPDGSYEFWIREPGGTVTVYAYPDDASLVHDDLGVFYVDWTIQREGTHYYGSRASDGAAEGADEALFKVAGTYRPS